MRKQNGITVMVLVITIVALLIVAGVSIASLSGDNGVVDQTLVAQENTRGASLIEEIDLYKVNFESGKTTATKEEKIDELAAKELLTAEEAATLKEGGSISVGTLSISFDMTEQPVVSDDVLDVALKYAVTFCDYDGTVLSTVTVGEGDTAVYSGATPTRAATEEYTYTFNNWVTEKNGSTTADFTNITSDRKVYASYTARPIYTVTFCNYDGTVLSVAKVNEGDAVSYTGSTPTRPNTSTVNYYFNNWVTTQYGTTAANLSSVTATQKVYASYIAKNVYTVTFCNYDGTVLATSKVEEGGTATYTGSTPSKPTVIKYGCVPYLQIFIGWMTAQNGTTPATLTNVQSSFTVWAGYKEEAEDICFTAGTKVLTENGMINIEDVKVGMKVYSKNMATGNIELKPVVETFINETDKDLCKVYTKNGVVQSTSGHEYYEKTKGWIEAKNLEKGDIIINSNNEEVIVENVEFIKFEGDKLNTVYNFKVKDNHTYFVGEDKVLVHNAMSVC